jgi:tetratricopeptide (TPR) repeat protein
MTKDVNMTKGIKSILAVGICVLTSLSSVAQGGGEILIQANRATLERDYTKALGLYSQYIGVNPEDFRGYFNRGTTEFNATKYADAIADFTKTLELNPIYNEAYYYRGQCYVAINKHDLAIKDYTYALSKQPRSVPFLKKRAEAYVANDQPKLALEDLNSAVALSKLSGDLYKRRAELKVQMGDVNGALRDYSSVEKLLPAYKMVHYIKGNLYLELEETDFACDEYKLALDNRIVVAERKYQELCQ